MKKKKLERKIINFKKLTPELLKAVNDTFPNGFGNKVLKIPLGAKDYFYAFEMIYNNIDYLIKLPKNWRKELGFTDSVSLIYD